VRRWWAICAALALLVAAVPVLAAEPLGGGATPALPPGLTAEQAEAAKRLLESSPEARKALEATMQKRAAEAEVEATRQDVLGGKELFPEGSAQREGRGAELPYDWQRSPYVGGLFKNRLYKAERETMVYFGHDLFSPSYGKAAMLENIPVSPNYIVGPGDEIVVRMWGRVEGTQRMVVDRDGKIFFPKFGSL